MNVRTTHVKWAAPTCQAHTHANAKKDLSLIKKPRNVLVCTHLLINNPPYYLRIVWSVYEDLLSEILNPIFVALQMMMNVLQINTNVTTNASTPSDLSDAHVQMVITKWELSVWVRTLCIGLMLFALLLYIDIALLIINEMTKITRINNIVNIIKIVIYIINRISLISIIINIVMNAIKIIISVINSVIINIITASSSSSPHHHHHQHNHQHSPQNNHNHPCY